MTILTVPDEYGTIGLAYAAASDADKIYIKESGSPYNETLVCNKELTLEGESRAVRWYSTGSVSTFTMRDHNTTLNKLWLQAASARIVTMPYGRRNGLIEDCKLENTAAGGYTYGVSHGAYGNLKINNCDFYATKKITYPIYSYRPSQGVATFTNNHFHVFDSQTVIFGSGWSTAKWKVENNVIDQLGSTTIAGKGISIGGATADYAHSIKGNIITCDELGSAKGADIGINLTGARNWDVTENIIEGSYCKSYAILVNAPSGAKYYIWKNNFVVGEVKKARHDGTKARVDFSKNSVGNYWGYGGAEYDADNDAIGDVPFTDIAGTANNQDDYPLMCSIRVWPECPYLAVKKKWALGRVGVRFVRL